MDVYPTHTCRVYLDKRYRCTTLVNIVHKPRSCENQILHMMQSDTRFHSLSSFNLVEHEMGIEGS
jgi:hypothetical protein